MTYIQQLENHESPYASDRHLRPCTDRRFSRHRQHGGGDVILKASGEEGIIMSCPYTVKKKV